MEDRTDPEGGIPGRYDSTTKLLNERGKTHGDFALNGAIMQAIKQLYRISYRVGSDAVETRWSVLEPYQREALDMIAHKIGRILAGDPNFRDHWDDIAGYARLVAERCPK